MSENADILDQGLSIVVYSDGGFRVNRNATREEHFIAVKWPSASVFASMFSPHEGTPPLGAPPRMVGYCAMGHAEIWSKEIACPLCAALKLCPK